MHVRLLRCVVSRELSGYMSFYISFSYCRIRENQMQNLSTQGYRVDL